MRKSLGTALRRAFGQDDLFKGARRRPGGDSSLLMSPRRMGIFSHLTFRPCSTQRAVAIAIGVGAPSAAHHLRLLEGANYLSSHRGGKALVYFPLDMILAEDVAVFSLLAEDKARAALSFVFNRPGARQGAVRGALGTSQQECALTMHRLENAGLVTVERGPRITSYGPTELLQAKARAYAGRAQELGERMMALLERDGVMPALKSRKGSILIVEVDQGSERARARLNTDPLSSLSAP
ncbi:MAG: hypothetical protein HZB92_00225 [Euryarchaeota archaeon]|nr:hypothetical protein [Euryarchaeota archaeon]